MILEVFFGANALDAIVKIAQIFVAFSEKLNFKVHIFWEGHKI